MTDRLPQPEDSTIVQAYRIPALFEQLDLSVFLESIGDGITIQDRNYRILFQNSAHRQLKGKHLGEYCYQAFMSRDSICPECPVKLVFEDGLVHAREHQNVREDRTLHVEITASPLRTTGGEIIAAIEVVRDISQRKRADQERELLIAKLEETVAQVRKLEGLLPTCASCRRLRDSEGHWKEFEEYLRTHTGTDFTHGICPECAERLYPEFYKKIPTTK